MPAIPIWASGKQFLVAGRETTAPGTFSAGPFSTIIVEEFKPADKPVWLDDKGWRGSPTTLYGRQEGVIKTDFTMKGACFLDTLPLLVNNIMGDATYTGGTNSGAPTTTTTNITVGQTAAFGVTAIGSIATGTVLAIGTGATLELITVLSVAGSNVTPTGPFVFVHASGATVQAVTGPYDFAGALLTSGSAQPGTLSFAHFLGPTATTMTRTYTGACLSDLSIMWNAETQLVTFEAKGSCWPSQPDLTTPTPNPSGVTPIASWRAQLGVGGPATGGTLVKYCSDGSVDVKRKLDVIFTAQNAQNPYVIARGEMDVSGKLNFVAVSDETQFLHMLNNDQPQIQVLIDNGQAGVNHGLIQFDSQVTSYKDFVPETGKAAVGYNGAFDSIANTTNAGASGGYSPGKLTVLNNVAPQSY